MIRHRILAALFLAIVLTGCSDRAEELYETARFEEQQFNTGHAAKLYQEILAKHPDSPFAVQARERLRELEKQ